MVAGYHHRGADPHTTYAVQVVLHDEEARVLDFRVWTRDKNTNLGDEDLVQQATEYINSLGKVDLVSFIWQSLEYENELCPCCGELTQITIPKKNLAGVFARERLRLPKIIDQKAGDRR